MNEMIIEIKMDPEIVPDKKKRFQLEAFELFKKATTLHTGVKLLEVSTWYDRNDKMKMIHQMAILELTKERDETIEKAIERYQLFKQEGEKNGVQE